MDRAVEGMIFINTPLLRPVPVPIVAISDLTKGPNVSRIMVDNQAAASLAFSHLRMLGHREIAVFTGPSANGDSAKRWEGLRKAAKEAGLQISSDLVVELGRYGQSNRTAKSDSGYEAASRLIASGKRFTALIAFNDVSAIGAIRAFLDSGLRVPHDISVVGFDDIHEASFSVPRLTTVRQPLHEMGVLAAKTLLRRIKNEPQSLEDILIEPRLIVRESTRQLNR
jgi:LacI family transcriptional regulator